MSEYTEGFEAREGAEGSGFEAGQEAAGAGLNGEGQFPFRFGPATGWTKVIPLHPRGTRGRFPLNPSVAALRTAGR